jgi:hypothetical protein
MENTNEVAIKIGGNELAQLPRFVLGLGNNPRLRGLLLCEKLVHLNLDYIVRTARNRALPSATRS